MTDVLSQTEINESAKIISHFLEDGPGQINMLEPIDIDIRRHLITLAAAYLAEHDGDELTVTYEWLQEIGANVRSSIDASVMRADFGDGLYLLKYANDASRSWGFYVCSTAIGRVYTRREAKWILSFFGAIEYGKLQQSDSCRESDEGRGD